MAHEFYTAADFDQRERETRNVIYVMVVEGGQHICKRCGASGHLAAAHPSCAEYNSYRRYGPHSRGEHA